MGGNKVKLIKKVFFSIVVSLAFVFGLAVFIHAEETTVCNFNDYKLYNDTNTYCYEDIEINNKSLDLSSNYSNMARYQLPNKNDKNGHKTNVIVDDSPAKITIFTHGWNGDPDNFLQGWSGETSGSTYENSLVGKLAKLEDANVFVATFSKNKDDSLKLKFTTVGGNENVNGETESLDFSKNLIIVFGAINTGYDNDYIYTQFNYMMAN